MDKCTNTSLKEITLIIDNIPPSFNSISINYVVNGNKITQIKALVLFTENISQNSLEASLIYDPTSPSDVGSESLPVTYTTLHKPEYGENAYIIYFNSNSSFFQDGYYKVKINVLDKAENESEDLYSEYNHLFAF